MDDLTPPAVPEPDDFFPEEINEPSALDFVKSRLFFWRGEKVELPPIEPEPYPPLGIVDTNEEPVKPLVRLVEPLPSEEMIKEEVPAPTISPEIKPRQSYHLPWRVLLAVVLAILAQSILDRPERSDKLEFLAPPIVMYLLAAGFAIWGLGTQEWEIAQPEEEASQPMSEQIRLVPLAASFIPILLAFIAFGGNEFNLINLLLWALSLGLVIWGVWVNGNGAKKLGEKILGFIRHPLIRFQISPWLIVVVAAVLLVLFFRFYRLSEVPAEMFSDHAEKLYDVQDLLAGKHAIFFERNTGREFFQFYLTALIIQIFGTGISFLSLKLGTVIAGVVTLPYIYLLGKELGNKWVGILAFLLAGLAYWHNVIDRVALRFALYPLFVAPTLYYFIRGLRRSNRNDMIWAGIALGLGMHGYSPFRFVPFVVAIGLGIYLLHRQAKGKRWQAIAGLLILALVAFVIFLPLFRYGFFDNPDMYSYRAFTRLGDSEAPLADSPVKIFLENLAKACLMFFWDNGEIWVHSIPHRPALDIISAAMLFLGVVLVAARYVRKRIWTDLFLLVSIPLLMMPSILSLAFPGENPSLNRTGGAIIPVFIIVAFGLEAVLRALAQRVVTRRGRVTAVLAGILLVSLAAAQNFNLVFDRFDRQFKAGAWNTSQIGAVIRGYATSIGAPDTAYVIPYPYWVDTRLVGINAGYPTRDYALSPEFIADSKDEVRTKLFILKEEDKEHLAEVLELYPNGVVTLHTSPLEGKNFYAVLVPGVSIVVDLQSNP